jgi:predicted nuclease with TOPRIM domain
LTTWNRLSEKFDETLSQHELTLRVLLKNLEASESNGERLTRLSGELSRQNEDLRSYNGQIGERMQERDEELAGVYEDLEGYKRLFRKALIVIAVMGAYILIPLVIKVCRFLKVIPI